MILKLCLNLQIFAALLCYLQGVVLDAKKCRLRFEKLRFISLVLEFLSTRLSAF